MERSVDSCTGLMTSLLYGRIAEGMQQLLVDRVRVKWWPILRIPTDTYSDGVRIKMTALFQQKTQREHLYISLTAAKQASRQPLVDFIEVRVLVVYSQWVRIVTARTTLSYITSIVEGCDNIANQMEILQTPWLDATTLLGQQCVLLAVFESIGLQSPDVEARAPSVKRKLSIAEKCGNKKKKLNNIPDGTKAATPIF